MRKQHIFKISDTKLKSNNNVSLDIKSDTELNIKENIYIDTDINKLFDKIFVISFANDIEQRKLIKKYFDKYDIAFEFIDAIDGNKNTDIVSYYKDYESWTYDDQRCHRLEKKYKKKLLYSPAAIGLLLSYKQIFLTSLENKYNNILIFEDDTLFDKNFNLKLSHFIHFINNNYDLLYLGCSHHIWNDPAIQTISSNITSYYKSSYLIDGSFATAFNTKVLPDLITLIEKKNAPIDVCFRDISLKDNSYIIYPNICIAETTRTSSISNLSRNLRNHAQKVHWDLSNIDFTRGVLKVSILIANYNSENTIQYTLDSIKKQSYPNTETIIIDDKSSDNSVSIIKQWISDNSDISIKLIELNKNIGAYKCRNIGLKNSDGFFITILDSDDILLKDKILTDVYNYFNMPDYEIFFSLMYRSQNIERSVFMNEYLLLKHIDLERNNNRIKFTNTEQDYEFKYKYRFGLPTIFVERSFFEKYGKWNEKFRYGMDIELIQRYVIKKYNKYIDHKTLYNNMYLFKSSSYGIFCNQSMNYVSFPMNEKNATNVCKDNDRERIHKICNQNLKKLLTEQERYGTIHT